MSSMIQTSVQLSIYHVISLLSDFSRRYDFGEYLTQESVQTLEHIAERGRKFHPKPLHVCAKCTLPIMPTQSWVYYHDQRLTYHADCTPPWEEPGK